MQEVFDSHDVTGSYCKDSIFRSRLDLFLLFPNEKSPVPCGGHPHGLLLQHEQLEQVHLLWSAPDYARRRRPYVDPAGVAGIFTPFLWSFPHDFYILYN